MLGLILQIIIQMTMATAQIILMAGMALGKLLAALVMWGTRKAKEKKPRASDAGDDGAPETGPVRRLAPRVLPPPKK